MAHQWAEIVQPVIYADSVGARWNADIVATFFRVVLATGDAPRAATFLAENFADYDPSDPADAGPREVVAKLQTFWEGFPEGRWTLEEIVAAGDHVAARSVFTGTQTGMFSGMAPSGRRVAVSFMDFYLLAEGRIYDHWHVFDELGMMRGLGAA